MAKVPIELYQSNNEKNGTYGKIFGRVRAKETMDTRQLAEHIAQHGSVYTKDVIMGVLAAAEKCIPELLLDGYAVKLNGLGTFRLRAHSRGEAKPEDFSAASIKSLGIRFAPDQSAWSDWKTGTVKNKSSLQLSDYYVVSVSKTGKRTIKPVPGRMLLDGDASGDDDNTSGGSSSGGTTGGGSTVEDRP